MQLTSTLGSASRCLSKTLITNHNPESLEQVFGRAEEKGIKIDVTERFKDRLVDEGYNPAYGARPLRRAIMRLLEDSMAERMLTGDIKARAASRCCETLLEFIITRSANDSHKLGHHMKRLSNHAWFSTNADWALQLTRLVLASHRHQFSVRILHALNVVSYQLPTSTSADAETVLSAVLQEGDSVIIDVDADGQVSVLNGDKKMTQMISETPAGIS